jgi:hypothetical protein
VASRPGRRNAAHVTAEKGFSVDRVSAKIRLGCRETRFYEAEIRCAETTPEVLPIACRDKMRARIPASSGLFATSREISALSIEHSGAVS